MNTPAAGGEDGAGIIIRNGPFTAAQWQELEHQALVYKYMISGMPIPPHLLFTIKTSLHSSIPHHPPHHPSIGWRMGFGRKTLIDPEPGRCRRTDGKKWRCSKEAYPDSKYCQRHMHRGRNRSTKPTAKSTNNINHAHLSSNALSSQDHFLLDSSPYRERYGMKEEHSFFSESTMAIKKSSSAKQTIYSSEYDQLALKLDGKDEPQKVMHHFFDEWPLNHKDSSPTQLSISIPTYGN
ncbi:growth-regulating factor 6-like [Bidens hawaiensis]|uniref:growth-regulating factor 6-like n=1 Tax=Bidens hawaiensis TaxID=980011 RepID=UPI00404B5067